MDVWSTQNIKFNEYSYTTVFGFIQIYSFWEFLYLQFSNRVLWVKYDMWRRSSWVSDRHKNIHFVKDNPIGRWSRGTRGSYPPPPPPHTHTHWKGGGGYLCFLPTPIFGKNAEKSEFLAWKQTMFSFIRLRAFKPT